MKRLASVYLDDIIEGIEKIEEYIAGLTEDEFYENTLVQDSVVRRLEIIGEAVKNMPAELKGKYPEVNWKSISGMRDIFAHAYFRINQKLVWRTITGKLPDLKEHIVRARSELAEK